MATLHAEALGFGRAWAQANGGLWVVHRHEITYLAPVGYGDELELTTEVQEMRGARAVRQTSMRLLGSGQPVLAMRTEWVWVRARDGRPQRLPPDVQHAFADD